MHRTVKRHTYLTCILLTYCFLFSTGTAFAKTKLLYVSDILVVTMREGPSKSYRTVKTVKSGEKLVYLDEDNKFIKVRAKDGTEGWVARQYTLTSPPKAVVIKSLNNEIERLSVSNQKLTKKAEKLATQLKERKQSLKEIKDNLDTIQQEGASSLASLTKDFEELQSKYTTLFDNSRDAMKIRKERDAMKSQFDTLNSKIEALETDNSSLSTRKNLYWFLSGGGVFLLGWLIGKVSSGRKSRPSLSL